MSVISLRNIYQIKVTLIGINPPIWRRILVREDMQLNLFHRAIQVTMGWDGSHLHKFVSGENQYGIVNNNAMDRTDIKNEKDYKLNEILDEKNNIIKYDYNFSNNWNHNIHLEKILPYQIKEQLPKCIKGKRACPPDDCGGITSYQYFLDVLQDVGHIDFNLAREWFDSDYNPEKFDVNETNIIYSLFFKNLL